MSSDKKFVNYAQEPDAVAFETVEDKNGVQDVKIESIPVVKWPANKSDSDMITYVWHLRAKTPKARIVYARYAGKMTMASVGSSSGECEIGLMMLIALQDAKQRGWTGVHIKPRFYKGEELCKFIMGKFSAQGELPTYNGQKDFPEYNDPVISDWYAMDPDSGENK
jgi:hypothetical protein